MSYTLTGGVNIPDLSSYKLMNASQALEFQRLSRGLQPCARRGGRRLLPQLLQPDPQGDPCGRRYLLAFETAARGPSAPSFGHHRGQRQPAAGQSGKRALSGQPVARTEQRRDEGIGPNDLRGRHETDLIRIRACESPTICSFPSPGATSRLTDRFPVIRRRFPITGKRMPTVPIIVRCRSTTWPRREWNSRFRRRSSLPSTKRNT